MQNVANTITEWVTSSSAEQPLLVISASQQSVLDHIETAKRALGATEQEQKQIASGNHPDIFTIVGEKNRIYIKDIEALKPLLAHKARKRLVLIPHADQLLPEAASALLKILEEPSPSTRFLLGAKNKRGILPTIRSRCRVIFAGKEMAKDSTINTDEFLTRLSGLRKADPFSEEELEGITRLVHGLAQSGTATPALLRVSQRLRDYYKTASIPGGNTKLAADILLASLANLRNTISYVNHTS
ncbi:MAG: hypothetical protein A3C02_03180 [Candidatus Andersenbacteria bacterium RIFCSPHIGHO2_02_FULL_45_11]|uniref:DNA polymerase III subunit delta n=1 Tax=Candidatus Andersenbacteria bacterium RIFCSPHIGHO2_12_FULL_45_11 TaxID=1797281 RepID=A0A1G1X2D6_9BACT|nr:MAG: hypothetical protein A2805_01875 [Candidatus Andersenbacteria bacterium RIFCSPHIGHO2_01_FULL_46_36]OGY34013.1 MAG: hypothetical protein A3C02_03180 [Candidatus Andersenbacteria bacterium RIFCSPHIGHO2_02_FULL_45_11]OGY34133.1 MAG: hypothetical protein A3D99_00220 [Candidatus Andersenbacteria bacterium RIFCSPHIGHO2_12_FULL_45_11]QBM02249.1 hypothetical protein [uncultured archaeon]